MARTAGTLAHWPPSRVIRAMRAWRRGCVATLPWFRATPFAAASHYRDRTLAVGAPRSAPHVVALMDTLPTWDHTTFWVIDAHAATALWLAHLLRRSRGLAFALAFNGWYDADGALDGRAEIALLLALSERPVVPTHGEAGLICERERLDASAHSGCLDNRYRLGDEELPSVDHLRQLGRRRVCLFTERAAAPDLAAWVDELRSRMAVDVIVLESAA